MRKQQRAATSPRTPKQDKHNEATRVPTTYTVLDLRRTHLDVIEPHSGHYPRPRDSRYSDSHPRYCTGWYASCRASFSHFTFQRTEIEVRHTLIHEHTSHPSCSYTEVHTEGQTNGARAWTERSLWHGTRTGCGRAKELQQRPLNTRLHKMADASPPRI